MLFFFYTNVNPQPQLWLKVDHTKHPEASTKTILEIEESIFDSCIEKGVLAIRGSWFRAEQDVPPSGLFFRTTFAAASEDHNVYLFDMRKMDRARNVLKGHVAAVMDVEDVVGGFGAVVTVVDWDWLV